MMHQRTLHALEFPKLLTFLEGLCLSPEGKALANAVAPLSSLQEAEYLLTLYEESRVWAADASARKLFTEVAFPDVSPLLREAKAGRIRPDLDAFWALRAVLNLAQSAVQSITATAQETKWPNLVQFATKEPMPVDLRLALNRCISDDAQIKDNSSPELFRLRSEIRTLHQHCLARVHDYAAKYNILPYLQDEFMTISQDRYVLPLKATYKARLQGILHDWSQTGETCYFEPMFLVELNNRLQELKREEREEELKILDYLAGLLEGDLAKVVQAVTLLAELDVLSAKRKMAELLDCTTITFTESSAGLHLYGARHPLLALQAARPKEQEKPLRVHPLDIWFRPEDHVLLITGGNAGGKTVCLKTLGLLYAMAASGLPTPCEKGSHLFWLERLDAFIGDEQDLEDHVSTFTAQITHLSKAWKYLEGQSLVLLDEFGAGTDPTHGAALAQAVLDELLERGAYVLAATHFPTLKIWAVSTKGARAASMLFDPTSKRPLFTLAYDQVGASQTLIVARDHGLPEAIIARAEKYLLLTNEESFSQLDRLNALAVEREEELKTLRALEEKTKAEARNLKEKLTRERERLENEINKKVQELMHAWQKDKMQARQALSEMKRLRQEVQKTAPKEEAAPLTVAALPIGMRVRHKTFHKFGTITAVDARKNKVRLDMGGISLWAQLSEVVPEGALKGASAPVNASHTHHPQADEGFALTIDVRGQTVEQALSQVQQFLDRMLMSGFSSVEIIHGRGTGVLRRELHQYLATYPGIQSFTLAPEDQGGDGKTIVVFA